MISEIICPHCGTRNPTGSFFCNRCGASLTGDTDITPQDPAAPLRAEDATPGEEARDPASTDPDGEAADEADVPWYLPPRAPERPAVDVEAAAADEPDLDAVDEPTIEELLTYFPPEEARAADDADPAEIVHFPDEQLIGAGQGYLETVSISGDMATPPAPGLPKGSDTEHWRTIRALVREEPVLATASGQGGALPISYRQGWLILLVFLVALLPFVFEGPFFLASFVGAPTTPNATHIAPQRWSGVNAAYDAIAGLADGDEVLVLWQADPSTTGELDIVALPVISHLLERGARSVVVTLLPTGLGSARRLYADAVQQLDDSAMISVMQGWVGEGVFLAGGAAALPLVAQNTNNVVDFAQARTVNPRLVVIVAAQADDAQQWLEIVQPVNRLPVVAITSAAADPILRPYLTSNQLRGLVSGFDGASSYQSLRSTALGADAQRSMALAVNVQDWGAILLMLLVVVSTVLSLTGRDRNV